MVHRGECSCVDVTRAHLERIDEVNERVNAIVTRTDELALESAAALDAQIAKGNWPGPLTGLPVAHKDLFPTKGIRTTWGSRLFEHHVPDEDALVVERLRAAGAVTVGKTNTPEWGAGSQTFNDVFGATRNPYDLERTCGGSSGGAAAALAARMIPIADGSDMGGSLRNPAGFCNVVGFRVSPGRVPALPTVQGWATLGVTGPMARNVADCALMLSAIAGPDPRSPVSIDVPGERFAKPLDRDFKGARIAISPDFGGQLPVARETVAVIESARSHFETIGCNVEADCPDFTDADEVFKTLRAWSFAASHGEGIRQRPEMYKDSIIWNASEGLKLTGSDVSRAEKLRTALYQRVISFFETYDFLVLPVSQVPPFPVTTEWVEEIEGKRMETYIDWMQSCYFVSALGLPAISVPAGFTEAGLPVGLQIVGGFHQDFDVLQIAHAFEQATGFAEREPAL